MAQESARINDLYTNGVRVRMPGKYIVLILFLPVALVALGAGVWLNIMSHRSAVEALEYRKSENGVEAAYFTLPEFLVDLSPDFNGRTAYLKMRASILLDHQETDATAQVLAAMQPVVMERLTIFLRALRPGDFQGSDSMTRIKREMLRRVNLVIAPADAGEVVIEEIVIQ